MSHWQLIYLALIPAASGFALWGRGKQAIPLAAVMWLNFAATMTFAFSYLSVAILDLLCATAIVWMYKTKRESCSSHFYSA